MAVAENIGRAMAGAAVEPASAKVWRVEANCNCWPPASTVAMK